MQFGFAITILTDTNKKKYAGLNQRDRLDPCEGDKRTAQTSRPEKNKRALNQRAESKGRNIMQATGSIDVENFIDEQPISPVQWFLFGLCFTAILLDGFDTAVIGYIAPSLISEWNVSRPDLAPVLSAALFGLAAGALVAGPIADRFGRKTMLIASVTVMGIATLASSFSGSLDQLVIWRFVSGLGLGAAMPSSVTLMSELCPASRRATLTNASFCGFPVGAAFGGFLAAWMIPAFGWRSVLVLGGVVPLALAVLMFLAPESPRYMVARRFPVERIRAVLRRISSTLSPSASITMTEARAETAGGGLRLVLSPRYIVGSMMLLLAYFFALIVFYAVVNWMPTLFKDAGISGSTAALISSLFTLGGCGAVLSGWLMDRVNAKLVIAAGFVLAAIGIYAIGHSVDNLGLLTASVFIGGAFLTTSLTSLPALAASFYPTAGRTTGVAWMLGFGRFGGVAGSYLVAELSRRHMTFADTFLIVAIASLASAASVIVMQLVYSDSKRAVEATAASEAVAH
ncbi:MFS transporter [Bradyrhizobium sp. dw_78]|uniref:MFS transporter n=1 Tax=Bradyrhizobium sp. dw_78 TaxID=2719793 RepID=UPI00201C0625|nr:MFS transporter [Bradyrhizobium sp. dw_78]